MYKRLSFAFLCLVLLTILIGCSSSTYHSVVNPPPAASTPVSITMTDDPPSGVSVLFFQVSLTSATLTPAAGSTSTAPVSLIENPVQVDVTQLQALSAFLAGANVPSGNYSGLNLTFANPQLVILNSSDASLGSSCAVGSICTLTPAIDNAATVSFTGTPFPIDISANSPLGFLVDFHLNTVIQSDLSVNLGVANGITLSQLPAPSATAPPPFGFLTGTVGTVNASQDEFTFATPFGQTFTVDINNNTFVAPALPCPSPGFISCLHTGDTVWVQVASVESNGDLLAAKVILLLSKSANQQLVDGTVTQYGASGVTLLVHDAFPNAAALPLGAVATVTIDNGASFSVDSNGFTIPPGVAFAGVDNFVVGQNLRVAVDPGSLKCGSGTAAPLGGFGPPPFCTFSTNSLQLEPSQITGTIASIASPGFTLNYETSPCGALGGGPVACNVVALISVAVGTTTQTTYESFDPDNFSGLADNDIVSVYGWLYGENGLLDPAIGPTQLLAADIRLQPVPTY